MVESEEQPTFEDILEAAKFLDGKINRTQTDSSEMADAILYSVPGRSGILKPILSNLESCSRDL